MDSNKNSNKSIQKFQNNLKQFLSANGLNVVISALKVNECCIRTSTEICDSIKILNPGEFKEFVKKGFYDKLNRELTSKYYYLIDDLICTPLNTYPHEIEIKKLVNDLKKIHGPCNLDDFFKSPKVVING
ncbi:hypothetical protein MMKA1_p-00010 (plasmid) [Methanococcus maripaludis KA1]|uniref:Uncharacterized protein n=1 Tax=Methanococcus maripaludis KA1 TaxID=637914 RepID=A0A2Z5PNR8_METMI|nr:hypothetical protein [Methanococcus maripaludis]BAP62074.1 hypothetical protein MMKA1_p-00010 [Methanococcus maripaludis KA1]